MEINSLNVIAFKGETMDQLNLSKVLTVVQAVQKEAGLIHLNPPEDTRVLLIEGGKNYTSSVDLQVQRLIQGKLREQFSDIGFLGEEGSDEADSQRYRWVVDPTDGTAVFSSGGAYYSISIALADKEEGKLVMGSVYQPRTGRFFLRVSGEKPWVQEPIQQRDGNIVTIERLVQPSDSFGLSELMGCSFGTSKHYNNIPGVKEKLAGVFTKEIYPELDNRSYGMIDARPASGSSALFLSDIANGRYHFALLFFQAAWDMAVGAMIARDAGCVVTCGLTPSTYNDGTGDQLEELIACGDKKTLVNVCVYANKDVQDSVEAKFEGCYKRPALSTLVRTYQPK